MDGVLILSVPDPPHILLWKAEEQTQLFPELSLPCLAPWVCLVRPYTLTTNRALFPFSFGAPQCTEEENKRFWIDTPKELKDLTGSKSPLETMQPVFCQSLACSGRARDGFTTVLGLAHSIYIFQSLKKNRDQRTKINPLPFSLCVCFH